MIVSAVFTFFAKMADLAKIVQLTIRAMGIRISNVGLSKKLKNAHQTGRKSIFWLIWLFLEDFC